MSRSVTSEIPCFCSEIQPCGVTGQHIEAYTLGMKSKPEVDGQIGKIIDKHLRLDKADELFTELSKVGGNAFKSAMIRVKRIVRKLRA
jgi:hypothetical protein